MNKLNVIIKRFDSPDNVSYFEKLDSTNPCGEIPLCPYDSCRLLAINLYSYVDNPFTEKAAFNFDKFNKHVAMAQRIMDDIVDFSSYERGFEILAKYGIQF